MEEPELAENNRKKCSFCDKSVEKGTYYFSTEYSSGYGKSNKSICINCMIRGIIKNYFVNTTEDMLKKLQEQIDLMIKQDVIKRLK